MSTVSPAPAEATRYPFDLGRCVVADVETYPNHWCVGFHGLDTRGERRTWSVEMREDLGRVLTNLARHGRILVTYNGDHFDIPVIRAILKGFDPYAFGSAIIAGQRLPVPLSSLPPLGCDHIDLSARLRRGGAIPGLKKVAAYLGRPRLQELPVAPGTILGDDEWQGVKAYNIVDLGHTQALLERFAPELQALAALGEEQGQDLRSTPTPRVVECVFLEAYRRERGAAPVRPEPPREVLYRGVPGVRRPQTPEAAAWHDRVVDCPLRMLGQGERVRPDVPRARFSIGRLMVTVGRGGLHSVDAARVYYETRKHRLVSIDVGSFYPSLIATKGIAPRSYGDVGAAMYRDILERRLELKRRAKSIEDPEERKRLDVQVNGLKLVLNATFGKLGDPYSTLFDPAAFLAVTLSGQLMLIDLIERLTAAGVRVLSANTDGLFLRVRRDNRRWREVLGGWESDTGMTLEVDALRRLAILASNRFATLDRAGKVKRKGAGVKGSFQVNPLAAPNNFAVADAVVDALLRDVPPEVTVGNCADPVRFCSVTQRSGKVAAAVLADLADGSEVELPRVCRWYKARESTRRIVHRFEDGRHTTPAGATAVNLALDLGDGRLPADLDRGWYSAEARKVVQAVPGYRHRAPKRLQDHPAALDLYRRGLAPVPKWAGKAQPRGSDRGAPTFLWEWSRYATFGTYTGPAVAILVLDVDDPAKFERWVDKGNSPLLEDRWGDFAGCLVSCRGEATPGQVRTGQDRGKLIFRLVGDAAHPLARIAPNYWAKLRGVEVFYGQGMPSVLGAHPDGTQYRLDGTLGEAPGWVLDGLTPVKRLKARGDGDRPRSAPGSNGHPRGAPGEHVEVDPSWLEGLPKELAALAPELGRRSVGWRTKDLGQGRVIWVGRCPFDAEHDSGTSTDGDLDAGYNQDGIPYVHCKHASCTSIPAIDRRLRAAARPAAARPAEPPPEIAPTAIARAILGDLDGARVARHCAPTGSGKTYSSAQSTALRWRADGSSLVALPTVRLAEEFTGQLGEFAPEAFEAGAVALVYGRKPDPLDSDPYAPEGEDDEDEDLAAYPIDEDTRIIVCTHAQLGRRGFSRFGRGIWEKLAGFAILIDEGGECLRRCRWEIALAHRVKRQMDPDRSGGWLIPLDRCPMSSYSGNCGNCRPVRRGGVPRFNRFGIRELAPPPRIEIDADAVALHHPRSPLAIAPGDLTLGAPNRVGHTTFAAEVLAWRGTPLDADARRTAPTFIFRRDTRTGGQPYESPTEVLQHLLEFAHQPCVTTEFAVDAEGKQVRGEDLAALIALKEARWDEGITFPHRTCDCPRLLLTDLLMLEKLRRHAAEHRVGVVFVGATFGPDDADVLRSVWPDLVEYDHPSPPEQRVKQVAIVAPKGRHGIASLRGDDDRLITAPLESCGLGLVFCARRSQATALYEVVAMQQPTARLAVENHLQLTTRRTLHEDGNPPIGTYVTYSRGVLGTGANILEIRHLVVDANAFRAIGSFNPREITPEEFDRNRAEERCSLILQNVGRALRGEAGKTTVLIILNADAPLLDALVNNPAVVEGSELPPVVATGSDLVQLVDQSRRWLEAGGGEWPEADPGQVKPRSKAGRKPGKTPEDVLEAAAEAIKTGVKWREFEKKHHPGRQLDATEVDALKSRFDV